MSSRARGVPAAARDRATNSSSERGLSFIAGVIPGPIQSGHLSATFSKLPALRFSLVPLFRLQFGLELGLEGVQPIAQYQSHYQQPGCGNPDYKRLRHPSLPLQRQTVRKDWDL